MINIEEHRKWVFVLLEKANIPTSVKEDVYQDFCVYYYSRTENYDSQYSVTTYLQMMFRNFLSMRAQHYNAKKRQAEEVCSDVMPELPYQENYETKLDAERIYDKLPKLFKVLYASKYTPEMLANEEGVTRQAIQAKLKIRMRDIIQEYREDYA